MAEVLITSQVPGNANVAEGSGATVSTTFLSAVDGTLDGVQFKCPTTVSGTFEGVAWSVDTDDSPADTGTGTQLAAVNLVPSMSSGALITVPFASPVPVLANVPYRIGVRTSEGRYAATGGFFASSGLTVGNLTAPQTGATTVVGPVANGAFIEGITLYPNKTFGGGFYFVGPVFTPTATEADGAIAVTLPPLQAASSGTVTAVGNLAPALPPLQASAAGTVTGTGQLAATLPALQLTVTGESDESGQLSLTLPHLTGLLRGTVETPPATGLVGAYRAIVTDLGDALRALGAPLRVVDDLAANVDRGAVVVGPPTFLWEGLCSPDEPTGATFEIYLVEDLGERAVDRLLVNLPALLVAVGQIGNETSVTGCVPGAFPSGTSDLPCYQVTAETTF